MRTHFLIMALTLVSSPAFAQSTQIVSSREARFSVGLNGFRAQETHRTTLRAVGDFRRADQFSVAIDNAPLGGVNAVEGLEMESDTVEFSDQEDIPSRPRRPRLARVAITRETSTGTEWLTTVAGPDNQGVRKDISVILKNEDGAETGRIELGQCQPVRVLRERGPQGAALVRVELDCLELVTHFPVPAEQGPNTPPAGP